MFPLKQRIISGLRFGQKPWYGSKHLGDDYRANYEPVYAPFNGTIINAFYGSEGGNTIWFKPDHDNVCIRLMHLKSFVVKTGHVSAGQQIAVSGNTGLFTTGPHLHVDITRNWSGTFWKDFNNFIDPETYNWNYTAPQPQPMQQAQPSTPTQVAQAQTSASFTVKVNKAQAAVRSQAKSSAPQAGSKVLYKGDTFKAIGTVQGESVSGNSTWYKSEKGNYIWSGGLIRI
jgi:hypothetical protein